MMKLMKKFFCVFLVACICLAGVKAEYAQAKNLDKYFEYSKKDKLYNVHKMYKGMQFFNKGDSCVYQVMKMTKNKISMRRLIKVVDSDDPVFGGKSKTYALSSNCKFYYRNVTFPCDSKKGIAYYKRIPRKIVQKTLQPGVNVAKFYGAVYAKKGKVVAIACDGGD